MKFQSQITELLTVVLLLFSTLPLMAQDTIPPAIRCKTGVVIVLPVDGEITVAAQEFDDGSLDNFTPQNQLKFYLNGDPAVTSYTVNCDSFKAKGVLEEFREVFYLNVEDNAGNVSACQVELIIQDNKFICGRPILNCSGCIRTWNRDQGLLPVRIGCSGDTSSCYSVEVVQSGPLPLCRNWDNLNGVSTADIVLIQRHLLGLAEFESPLQYIAADANNTETVSAADISTIRKIILGVIDDFNDYGLESWRFFAQLDSISFVEGLYFQDTLKCPDETDVTAVKVGDVHPPQGGLNRNTDRDDPSVGCSIHQDRRSGPSSVLLLEEAFILGLEMVIRVDRPADHIDLLPGQLELRSGHYHITGNEIRISWNTNDGEPIRIEPGEPLFLIDVHEDSQIWIRSGEIYDQFVDPVPIMPRTFADAPSDIYPNPCRTGAEVFINTGQTIVGVSAIDLNGKETPVRFEVNDKGVRIGTGRLLAGIHILRLRHPDGSSESFRLVLL